MRGRTAGGQPCPRTTRTSTSTNLLTWTMCRGKRALSRLTMAMSATRGAIRRSKAHTRRPASTRSSGRRTTPDRAAASRRAAGSRGLLECPQLRRPLHSQAKSRFRRRADITHRQPGSVAGRARSGVGRWPEGTADQHASNAATIWRCSSMFSMKPSRTTASVMAAATACNSACASANASTARGSPTWASQR